MMKKAYLFLFLFCACVYCRAQRPVLGKLSPMLRSIVTSQRRASASSVGVRSVAWPRDASLCAFVRTSAPADALLSGYGGRVLAQVGDICIVDLPLSQLGALSTESSVLRIEAGRGTQALLDTMAVLTRTDAVYAGKNLPQAYTGRGVVVGVEDIGFDVTHPVLWSDDGEYRVRCFWDQLSADTLSAHRRYVGAAYASADSILAYARSRDALTQYHGTHTSGIAAGNGYDGQYRGIAYESDICLVSNAVNGDEIYIDSTDIYKYTNATDALGFKYIFDYAQSCGMPCVVSFSEGSPESAHADNLLYYMLMDRLTGPGRIFVASAGNTGHYYNYIYKPQGITTKGTFFRNSGSSLLLTMASHDDFTCRITGYVDDCQTIVDIPTAEVKAHADSVYEDSVVLAGQRYLLTVEAYRSYYDASEVDYDISLSGATGIGTSPLLSVEAVGKDAEVSIYRNGSTLMINNASLRPDLYTNDATHYVYSPGAAPATVCVGATSYRTSYCNAAGDIVMNNWGHDGAVAGYSSVGPARNGSIKPDVVAPGTNVVSAMSSYYMEANSEMPVTYMGAFDVRSRTYGWSCETGTSMSTPAVAGIIALWLQANPSLTPADVKAVIARTSRPCSGITSYPSPRCGYGSIDAYAGLLDVLGLTAIDGISVAQPDGIRFGVADGRIILHLDAAATRPLHLRIYATTGALLMECTLSAGQTMYEVDCRSLPRGVYAVQVNGATPSTTGSTLLRL